VIGRIYWRAPLKQQRQYIYRILLRGEVKRSHTVMVGQAYFSP
jgi:hypothetical protein